MKRNNIITLEAKNLSIGYKKGKQTKIIAKNINFNLERGDLIGLIGANGIGKSTLLRTLTKFQPPILGDINVNAKSIFELDNISLAREMSVVLTENVSNTNLTVQETIALGRSPYTNWIGSLSQIDKIKTNEAIDLVGIAHLTQKKCYELSDGQFQKVMLARAIAQDSDIIILDEPTTHLDLYHKVSILKLLERLAKESNKTILFSTHEINVTISMCDKLIVMKKGELVYGSPVELQKLNTFDDMFPKGLIYFDKESKIFKIN